ncbi:MAG: SagB/ThcOx family dehydrogenase [Acidobacteria bacterium]|nr:SagB/ThcOx family dehydrogenase [Acidobacteriota bacterium]
MTATPGARGTIRPPLLDALQALTPAEQDALAEMARRYRLAPPRAAGPSGLAFVQSFLKADPRLPAFRTPMSVSAGPPALVKQFPGRRQVQLPDTAPRVTVGLQDVLERRRSSHDFGSTAMPLSALGALLHAACGVREFRRAYDVRAFPFRYSPSAGGLQPIDVYLVANDVDGLTRGLYYHDPVASALTLLDEGNLRRRMSRCGLDRPWLAHALAVLVLVCNLARVSWKYGDRGYRFAHIDAGVLAQNLYLAGTALELNTCAVAGYYEDAVHELLDIDGRDECAVLLFAVGSRPDERPIAPTGTEHAE